MLTSVALIEPLAFTSERKLAAPTTCPDLNFVSLTSVLLTVPLPPVSPRSMPMRIPTSAMFTPSLTPNSARVIVCALVTPLRLRVIWFVPLAVLLATLPEPEVTTAGALKLTGPAKLRMT